MTDAEKIQRLEDDLAAARRALQETREIAAELMRKKDAMREVVDAAQNWRESRTGDRDAEYRLRTALYNYNKVKK